MKARYQYRFYPTDQQRLDLAKLFGCVRVVFNDALAVSKNSGKYPGYNQLSKLLTEVKKTEGREWLNEVSSIPLQQSLKNLETAYKNFFDSVKGKRKGKKVRPPKFKKKSNQQSATFTKAGFKLTEDKVYLAKIGDISPIWSRELPSDPSSVTVIKDCAGRYFLSFVVEVPEINHDAENQSIGIDLGIKTFAVTSKGDYIKAPDYSKWDRKIRKLQKKLARQLKGSNRWHKTRVRIAKLHNKIADTRKDFLHKLTTWLVKENQIIVLEDLNVSGMVKNRKLARAISQQGWSICRTMLDAKSQRYRRDFKTISRWEPTSQYCSECGYKWGKLDLSIRSVLCLNCHTEHDRDGNASKNIENVGIGHFPTQKRTLRECKTTSVAKL